MMIFFFAPITSCYALSRGSRQISMQACLLGSLLLRIFAAIPTHRSRFACSVSCRFFPTWMSAFVAGSDGWPKKKTSLTICFTIYFLLLFTYIQTKSISFLRLYACILFCIPNLNNNSDFYKICIHINASLDFKFLALSTFIFSNLIKLFFDRYLIL